MDENVTPPAPESTPAPNPAPTPQPPPLRSAPPTFTPPIYTAPPRAKSGGTGWKIFAFLMLGLVLVLLAFVFLPAFFDLGGRPAGPRLQEVWVKTAHSPNRIVIVPVEGVIMSQGLGRGGPTMVEIVEEQFKRAAEDVHVKAVVLKVNSPGGEVMASDDIYQIVERFQRETGKPVIAAMGSLAASGGYYVSAPCQWIVANELTITGSIGVIMHGYNFRGLMDKVGVRPETFKSGRFKDMLSPDKREEDITQEERDMIQSMVNETFDKFKSVVADGRASAAKRNQAHKGRELAENWRQYADGRVLSGKEALKLGFVDELGNFEAAVSRAQKLAGITDANLIQYQPVFVLSDMLGSLLGQSAEARTLKIDVGLDTPKLQLGRMYFMYPLALPR